MESSGFFPSNSGDRIYKTVSLASFFNKLYSNGVFDNGLAIIVDQDMNVIVKEGWAMINGYWYHNDADKILTLSSGDALQSRIDNIILRYNVENRNIEVMVVEGDYSSSPTAPALVRTSAMYDLRLAQITVETGTTELLQSMIKDCRFDENDCGVVVNAIQHLNTEDIFIQYQDAFNTWFEEIKGQLSTDAAGNLQNEINYLRESLGLATDTYDDTKTYSSGDLVVYNHTIYECNTDNTTGEWDSTKWTIVPIIVASEN